MNQEETSFSPVQHWTIHRAMSFTTMSQLPYVGRHTHDFIGRLSSLLPGYTLELGRDLQKIPAAVSNFITDTPRYQVIHSLESDRAENGATKPLVSVIIPVYNGEDFIRDAVEHIMSQNYPALEIIIVDDGSTDRTAEIINELPVDIRYFKQPNAGPASARNRGIRDATADLLVFLDIDDLWPENNLHLLVDEMRNEPDADVIRGYAQIMEYSEETGEYDFVGNPVEAFPDYIGAAIYRSSAFEKVGLFDTTLKYGEDTDWFNRAEELHLKVKRLEDMTLLVRRHGKNMTYGKDIVELGKLRVFKKSMDRERARKQALMNSRAKADK
jgi:glycosyltransferase involved in cell wall biosynthesis